MVEMLMWPTNTTAVGAGESRSEESGSLGATSTLVPPVEAENRSSYLLMQSQMFLRSLTLKCCSL